MWVYGGGGWAGVNVGVWGGGGGGAGGSVGVEGGGAGRYAGNTKLFFCHNKMSLSFLVWAHRVKSVIAVL